ncbi:MAG: glycosyltransferase [Opitutae bacterium]|nr:glycosyltransferase [Opitutae bacterium]
MKFSIVVPSFNHSPYLRANLDSILLQEHRDVEILVNDGGSNDGSVEILASYGNRIQWSSGRDHGQTDAINKGLLVASGEILAYLNSDDIYLPGAFQRVAAHFAAHPACDLLYGNAWHLKADGSVVEAYPTEPWNYDRLFQYCFLCQPAVFWRRRLLPRFGLFDERLHFAMDYEYWLRLGAAAEIHHLPGEPLAGSRLHADTKTLRSRLAVHREILQVVRRRARRPADCYTWLKHLASIEATENGWGTSPMPEKQKKHAMVYAGRLLARAEEYQIELDDQLLRELAAIASDSPR